MATVITGVTLSLSAFSPIQCQNRGHFRGQLQLGGQVTQNGDCPRKSGTSGQLIIKCVWSSISMHRVPQFWLIWHAWQKVLALLIMVDFGITHISNYVYLRAHNISFYYIQLHLCLCRGLTKLQSPHQSEFFSTTEDATPELPKMPTFLSSLLFS